MPGVPRRPRVRAWYGDVVPVSNEGRIVGGALMLTGVSLIPLVTSVAVSILTARHAQALQEEHAAQLARLEERLDRRRR